MKLWTFSLFLLSLGSNVTVTLYANFFENSMLNGMSKLITEKKKINSLANIVNTYGRDHIGARKIQIN